MLQQNILVCVIKYRSYYLVLFFTLSFCHGEYSADISNNMQFCVFSVITELCLK
jgi:hypothetical protein